MTIILELWWSPAWQSPGPITVASDIQASATAIAALLAGELANGRTNGPTCRPDEKCEGDANPLRTWQDTVA